MCLCGTPSQTKSRTTRGTRAGLQPVAGHCRSADAVHATSRWQLGSCVVRGTGLMVQWGYPFGYYDRLLRRFLTPAIVDRPLGRHSIWWCSSQGDSPMVRYFNFPPIRQQSHQISGGCWLNRSESAEHIRTWPCGVDGTLGCRLLLSGLWI